MYGGVGAVTRGGASNPFDGAMGRALTMWSKAPGDQATQQVVLGTSWSWGGWFVKRRAAPTAAEKGLINALQEWAKKPNNLPNRQLLLGAAWKWGAEKQGAMRGMGEYFAPAAGMGEYFSGVGEYFSGVGAGESGTFADISVCSEECMKYVKADKRRLVFMTGSVAFGLGLAAAMVVFR